MSQNQSIQPNDNIFRLCGDIDICLSELKPKSICIVGLSRGGKSTLFNNVTNISMIGVVPEDILQDDCHYEVYLENAKTEAAQAMPGYQSVTLFPNIVDFGDYTLVDFGGFMDSRNYKQVIGISYVLKAAFQIVQQCQFILVLKVDYFRSLDQMFNSFKGFIRMFNFKQMKKTVKNRLLESVTVVITKARENLSGKEYATSLKKLSERFATKYQDQIDKQDVIDVMEYFSQHPEQFYLFKAAKVNELAPPSTIVQDHLEQRPYFKMAEENKKFKEKKRKNIFNLPFEEDYKNMKPKWGQEKLKKQIDQRVKSYQEVASILKMFLQKAMEKENLLNVSIKFDHQFNQMNKFNEKYDFYSQQIRQSLEKLTGPVFKTVFNENTEIQEITGIQRAQNVFKLYNLLGQQISYSYNNDPTLLEKFMEDYKDHLFKIIKLFRDTFCSSLEEQQIVRRFLFIVARGCRQFSMLYQIRPEGQDGMCIALKDSLKSIARQRDWMEIHKYFVISLHKNMQEVSIKLKSGLKETEQCIDFLSQLPDMDNCSYIKEMPQYIELKYNFLKIKMQHPLSPEQRLRTLFELLDVHKRKVKEVINNIDEEDEGDYPEDLNFYFRYLLVSIAHILLRLERDCTLSEDKFAYNRVKEFSNKSQQETKSKLIIEQASLARNIFIYCKDVESVCRSFEVILQNIPEKDYQQKQRYLVQMAEYCSKYGRTQKAVILYQRALTTCLCGNLFTQYKSVEQAIAQIQNKKEKNWKNYLDQLKQNTIIDPTEDSDLNKISSGLEKLFIQPYLEKIKKQKLNQ